CNVAANLRALGAEPVLLGVTGDDSEGAALCAALDRAEISSARLVTDPGRPTTVKTRIVAHSQQVVRADRESRADVASAPLERLREEVERALPACQGLVISDYGKGVINARVLEHALPLARRQSMAVSV